MRDIGDFWNMVVQRREDGLVGVGQDRPVMIELGLRVAQRLREIPNCCHPSQVSTS